jgi:DNA-binding CsgD family transcriptional regulator
MVAELGALGHGHARNINRLDPAGPGAFIGMWTRARPDPPPAEMTVYRRMAHHLGAAHRCRLRLRKSEGHGRSVDASDGAEARFERNGAKYIVARENQSQVRGLASLSDRERQVAAYLAIGQSTKETAYALGISDATVRVLLARAASKLGVRTRADLLGHAEVRLLCPPPCNEPVGPTAPSISATPGKRKPDR